MPNYKLLYFDARGRAEVIRLLFAAAEVPYEDVRLTKETWPDIKPKTPGGQLPVLEVDGKMFSQSVPIMTYLATEFGFHGSTPLESLAVNEILATAGDLKHALVMTMIEREDTRKAERIKHLKNEDMPRILGVFETTLSKNRNGYFVGSMLTLADLAVFDALEIPVKKVPSILADYPQIVQNMSKIREHPGMKTWLETRPQTPF